MSGTMSRVFHSCLHDAPPEDRFHTCPHPYHSEYSEQNLPPLLFRMEPPVEPKLPELPYLLDKGEFVLDMEGREMRDFPFLPRYISCNPSGWLLEYWLRTDPRLTYKDIRGRMTAPAIMRPAENALNMRREREARRSLRLSCWNYRRGATGRLAKIDLERVENWSYDQIRFNTTMDITYTKSGQPYQLKDKALSGDRTARTYPLDFFLDQGAIKTPSDRVRAAQSEFFRLSERAKQLGITSWRQLPDHEFPESFRYNTR
ncbi:hypothetical protein BDV25DRAFT_112577 [Aspergillus avenaceus]|uniref:Uncharacterized protein n=1 Tax=Aspergillus avenaceus TaxID=36643 RepID=A0A5N6TVJ8_ASPAV|nr:hypothetical protein BDV25DRAFT_112577 [Aspergillus avenaceus]